MDLGERDSHSFIVKIWADETAEDDKPRWYGHITHIPDGARQYFTRLASIETYIAPYLAQMGCEPGLRARMKRWLLDARRRGRE